MQSWHSPKFYSKNSDILHPTVQKRKKRQGLFSLNFNFHPVVVKFKFKFHLSKIKITKRNINNLRYADDTTVMAKSGEEQKSLLMRMKKESEKADLKLNIPKTKIMASDSISSWQIDGEKMETVTDFFFLVSKITVDGDCSHVIKRHLLLERKVMTNLLLLSHFSRVRLCATPSLGFSRQEHWSGLPFPSPMHESEK